MNKLKNKILIIVIILCILLAIGIIIFLKIKEKQDTEDSIKNIGKSASDFITDINNAQSHLNDFIYNYETGEVEYKENKLTLENYNKIKIGMSEEEVEEILGRGEKLSKEDANTYLIVWEDIDDIFCRVQLIFSKNDNCVLEMYQVGLK